MQNPIETFVTNDPGCQEVIRWGERASMPAPDLPPPHDLYADGARDVLHWLLDKMESDPEIWLDATYAQIFAHIRNNLEELNR